ncbi:hypothetical protein [Nonomuraea longicatena]|uniref:hypothetical protein n=1 Tax=Nonomuraea longicatena TaxID=83682 RepID=UPI0031CE0011
MTLALLAGAASACTATQAEAPPKPPQSWLPPGEEARRLTLPFDVYNFSPAEVMTREVAEDFLVRDCMRARGQAWEALPGPADSESAPPHRRRYGVIEPQVAAVFGYHTAPQSPGVTARKTKDLDRASAAPPNVQQAVGQCLSQARADMVKGAPKADAAFFNKVIFASFDASQRDEQVVRVFRSWSTCMAGEGFDYPDPLAAITDKRWQTREPSAEEIRAARVDVRCKEETGLTAVWAAAETRIQNDAVRADPEKFRVLKAVKDRQLAAARRIIARS